MTHNTAQLNYFRTHCAIHVAVGSENPRGGFWKSHGGDFLRVVLLGGGPGHIHYIRDKAKDMSVDIEVVLVSPTPHVFHAPAFEDVLIGRRPLNEAVIDLRKISTFAGVTFIQSDIEQVDAEKKLIKFTDRASLQFDYLSIEGLELPETFSTQQFDHGFYAKDSISFFNKLKELEAGLEKLKPNPFRVAVIGAGPTGIAVSRHVPARLRKFSPKLVWEIFEKKDNILHQYHTKIRRHIEKDLKAKDILFHTQFTVDTIADNYTIRDVKDPKRNFEADVIFFCAGSRLPDWMKNSGLPLTTDGFLDAHPNLTLKSMPYIMASGEMIGKPASDAEALEHAEALHTVISGKTLPSKKHFNKIRKKDHYLLDGKALKIKWAMLKENEKMFTEHQTGLIARLEHLRAVKEQKRIQIFPMVEENSFVDKLKKRLMLDLSQQQMEPMFEEGLPETGNIGGWFEKEYKDVFNDHYLSSFHSALDLLDRSFIAQGKPQYLRLYVSAPSSIKDVEILSQILVGAYRACVDRVPLRVHICGQAMNTVQFSLGTEASPRKMDVPGPVSYIALTRPLGLYGLLSQQGKYVWEGQWLSEVWPHLNSTYDFLAKLPDNKNKAYSLFQMSESGFVNDMVKHIGAEGWRVCVNLAKIPRWDGVDQIVKQRPMDQLIDKNWQKGFRYWAGQGEKFPDAQYLLWEPHLIRPPACLLVDPAFSFELERELKTQHNQELYYIGYAERTDDQQQTCYKLSDWEFESKTPTPSVELNL